MASLESAGAFAGVIVSSPGRGMRWAHGESGVFPSASLIKLPVLWTLFSGHRKGEWSLSEEITVPGEKIADGGLLHRWAPGGRLRLEDLALLMTAVSDNTAANLLIERMGIERINEEIRSLGLKKTVLGRKMLDFEAKRAGRDNFTCPWDMERLLSLFFSGSLGDLGRRALDMMSCQKLRSKLAGDIPVADFDDLEAIVAHKTGELPGSEHDCGVFFHRENDPVFVVVMTEGLVSMEKGVDLCRRVGRIVFDEFQNR